MHSTSNISAFIWYYLILCLKSLANQFNVPGRLASTSCGSRVFFRWISFRCAPSGDNWGTWYSSSHLCFWVICSIWVGHTLVEWIAMIYWHNDNIFDICSVVFMLRCRDSDLWNLNKYSIADKMYVDLVDPNPWDCPIRGCTDCTSQLLYIIQSRSGTNSNQFKAR